MFDERQFAEARTPGRESRLDIELDGECIRGRMRAPTGEARALVIGFHGAASRRRRDLPCFFPFYEILDGDCYQFHICDPELFHHDELRMGWFSGSRERPLQSRLPVAFQQLAERLDMERVIYIGASGGGFAALFYSRRHPRSIALALQPQTNLSVFYEELIDDYMARCWPEGTDAELDLRPVYAQDGENTVIYFQSTGDKHHYQRHFLPLMSELTKTPERIALCCDAWQVRGHRPVPPSIFFPWLRAAVEADSASAPAIVDRRYDIKERTDNGSDKPDSFRENDEIALLSRQLTETLLSKEYSE